MKPEESALEVLSRQISLLPTNTGTQETTGSVIAILRCRDCDDYGYVNCPKAKAPGGGDYLVIALQRATPCHCAVGAEFAKNQMEWNR